MEGELFNTIQKQEARADTEHSAHPRFPDISFAPPGTGVPRELLSPRTRERCAFAGVSVGILATISWFVIALGIIAAIMGVIFSYVGLKSSRAKYARIGFSLSLAGGVASVVYMLVIYAGLINYNYFTNELWGIPSGGVQVFE